MIHVVYFNQWFSAIAPIMKDIKEKHGDSIRIVASSKNPSHAYKNVADKFIHETWDQLSKDPAKEYCDWLIKTLKANCVDLFFVYKHQDWVGSHIEEIQTELPKLKIVLDSTALGKFSKKSEMYKSLDLDPQVVDTYAKNKSDEINLRHYIPEHTLVSEGYDRICKALESHEANWCLKLDSDIGGESFRRIVDVKPIGITSLKTLHTHTITHKEALNLVQGLGEDDKDSIMFMKYLYGPELSVDCYRSKRGFIAICRAKKDGRVERIYRDRDIERICFRINELFGIKHPFNVQFRYTSDSVRNTTTMRITDINLRLSGGLYLELALGLNLCEVCMLDLLGRESEYNLEDYTKFEESSVTHFETAIQV